MQANGRFTIAIHICLFLSYKDQKLIPSQEIAGSVKTNPVVIRRLMCKMKESGIIGSVAGARGGFYLAMNPEEIDLWRIYHSVKEGDFFFKHKPNDDCPVGGNLCELVDEVYKQAESSMEQVLGKITIRDLHEKLHLAIAE
jgi:Rrf2 family protein